MATRAGRFIQDQNLSFQLDGPAKGKSNPSQGQTKGLGGRKALNDISNSAKPTALQPSRKHNSANIISISEDFDVSKTKQSVLGKKNVFKAPEKAQVSSRKALSDLTNSNKPSGQVVKKIPGKKLTVVAEEPPSGEGFLHNHQNCMKAQKTVGIDDFLKAVGLDDDNCIQLAASPRVGLLSSRNPKLETPLKEQVMDEISELKMEDQFYHPALAHAYRLAAFGSPHSRRKDTFLATPNSQRPYMETPKFMLKESP